MTHPVLNVEDAPAIPTRPPEGSTRFGATVAPMGAAIGSGGLGAMYTVVEPGKRQAGIKVADVDELVTKLHAMGIAK